MSTKKSLLIKAVRAIIFLTVVSVVGVLLWRYFPRDVAVSPNIIAVSGRIESDDAAVSAKLSGRIREISVREGDLVKAGQMIATLDDEQLKARVKQQQSVVEQAESRLLRARQQIAVLQTQLLQSRLVVKQAELDSTGRVSQTASEVAAAEAAFAQAQAVYEQARYDAERFSRLANQGDISEREGKQAVSNAEAQKAALQAAQKRIEAARGAQQAAQASLQNPAIRASEVKIIEQQLEQARADIAAAEAEVARARAQLQEADANRTDLTIVAPFDGIVTTRAAEPGEVVAPGTTIVSIINPEKIYLRGFIPEGEIGRVKVGQSARVYLDSNPNKPLAATVSRIDPEASFTPENTYFRNDRVKQVVGVKLQLDKPEGFAKPGMPADGEVLVVGDQWPQKVEKR